MDESLRQIFLATNNPNDSIRANAENQLKQLEKNPEFMNYVKNVLMKDTSVVLKNITSIYFMVTMEKNWNAPELAAVAKDIQNNILDLLTTEDKQPKNTYQKLLHCIFENAEKEDIMKIFSDSGKYISSPELIMNKAALILYEEVFKCESLRFNLESIMEIMFDTYGNLFTTKFTELIGKKKFSTSGTCMKIVAKAYSNYSLPDFLTKTEVFCGFFNLATQILDIDDVNNEGVMKLQKWASHFLYKTANKGLKKYFKSNEIIAFIRQDQTLDRLYATFNKLLFKYLQNVPMNDKIPSTCADFFTLCASNKHSRRLIKSNYMQLISSFILPAQGFSEDVKDNFENNADAYLRERYNYSSDDIKNATSGLFEEILNCDKEICASVIANLTKFLENSPDDSTASTRYAIIGVLSGAQKNLIKHLTEEGFDRFVKNIIFADLSSHYPFLASQALYFLSLTESFDKVDEITGKALNIIVGFTASNHPIISCEACLALNVFFYNDSLRPTFKPIIASLFEKVLGYSKLYFLESLSTLSDTIIDCFTEDITAYAPVFVQTICTSFMSHIESDKDNISSISGCLTTIEKLVMTADDKPEIVASIYQSASAIIFYVFTNQKVDFYQECFDLMNSFLFTLKVVNESMFNIFILSLSTDKEELSLYPREISDLIDNFLTFGKERMISIKTLEVIYNIIDTFMPINSAEYDIYDEDFESACRIIDSLMLNTGSAVVAINDKIIPAVIHKLVSNWDFAHASDSLPLFALLSIMNCFIVAPQVVLSSLGPFASTFFEGIQDHKKLFKRVYDKKLFILFTGILFKLNATLPIKYDAFCDVLVEILSSLPDAVKKRNKLQEQADNDEEVDDEDDDDYYDDIYEDIYFVTILDTFDAYQYARMMLNNVAPNTVGETAIKSMSQSHIDRILMVLDAAVSAQK